MYHRQRTWHPKVSRRTSRKTIADVLKRQSNWVWHALLAAIVIVNPGSARADAGHADEIFVGAGIAFIAKFLAHRHPRDESVDPHVDFRVKQCRDPETVLHAQQQTATLHGDGGHFVGNACADKERVSKARVRLGAAGINEDNRRKQCVPDPVGLALQ